MKDYPPDRNLPTVGDPSPVKIPEDCLRRLRERTGQNDHIKAATEDLLQPRT